MSRNGQNGAPARAKPTPRLGLLLLLAATAAWLAAVVAAPVLARAESTMSAPLYQLFSSICHQQPERSFHLGEHPLAVCHRCFGLYLGFALGLLSLPRLPQVAAFIERHPRILLASTAPLLLDVALMSLNSPTTRFATGMLAAYPIALFCWRAADQILANRGRFSSEAA